MTERSAMTDSAKRLMGAIESRSAVVAVMGLGYVGLPLVRAVHDAGFDVIGYDVDSSKIEDLREGRAYLKHPGEDLFAILSDSEYFTPTNEEESLARADVIILCVPTPLGEHDDPDLFYVESSARSVAQHMKPGALVVLESTTYPGTTREVVLPILLEGANTRGMELELGDDLFVAYSPEREDPGRTDKTTRTIPKLIGGLDDVSLAIGSALYRSCVDEVHETPSAEVAEAAKLLENVYRAVNIALINEMKLVFDRMGIDVWEVIEAAATKPFGFQRFDPGPGLGGHCIPIDPFYLAWRAREAGHTTRFIELAGEINRRMPEYVVSRVSDALNDDAKHMKGAKILVLGVAYKRNVDDIRESPAAEIISLLRKRGAEVSYHDPHITRFPSMRRYDIALESVELTADVLGQYDCAVVVTDHDAIDWHLVGDHAPLIVDTRDAITKNAGAVRARVVKA